jgi:membrane-associated phospholipid phosphatase
VALPLGPIRMLPFRLLALFVLTMSTGACVSTTGRNWGAHATFPHWSELRRASVEVAKNPRVWVPLAGAAAFQIGGWDRDVSNWARENTPVFGSQRSAQDWSDRLRTASSVAYFSTVLATPDPAEPGPWIRDKAEGLTVQLGAIAVTGFATSTLKSATGRTRPNGVGTNSFPSGHTSHAAVLNALARDNLEQIDIAPGTRRALDLGLDALTVGTAWARVEAGAHFPSDTLASMALGNFISGVFDQAFFASGGSTSVAFAVIPLSRGMEVTVQWRH